MCPGVFPLLFLKGTTATLIALGDTESEVAELRVKADQFMRLVETNHKMESVALDESRNRIWCQSPRIEYRLQTQRYNLPSRCIGLLRPGRDIIVLPGGHEPTKEYWEFAKDVMGFDEVILSLAYLSVCVAVPLYPLYLLARLFFSPSVCCLPLRVRRLACICGAVLLYPLYLGRAVACEAPWSCSHKRTIPLAGSSYLHDRRLLLHGP